MRDLRQLLFLAISVSSLTSFSYSVLNLKWMCSLCVEAGNAWDRGRIGGGGVGDVDDV